MKTSDTRPFAVVHKFVVIVSGKYRGRFTNFDCAVGTAYDERHFFPGLLANQKRFRVRTPPLPVVIFDESTGIYYGSEDVDDRFTTLDALISIA